VSASATAPVQDSKRFKKRWFAYFGANSLAVSILLHVLFGVGATFLIVEHFQKKHVNFHATEPPSQHTEVEHKVELAKRNNVESAPPDLKRIVTKDVSSITLPEPPEVPTTDEANPTSMAGVDGVMGMGLGNGMGKGGSGGGGGIPLFGAPDGTGLEGDFYDLKQTPARKPTDMTYGQFYIELHNYVDRGWNEALLSRYYKSKDPLYASTLAISTRDSGEAPKAFGLEKEVQPALWIVHYHGRVIAPQSGDYRFVGFGDNVLVVKINNTTVLDAGWDFLTNNPSLHQLLPFACPKYIPIARRDRPSWDPHLRIGPVFHANAHVPMDMDILIGDDGGICNFFLLIEKEGEIYGNGEGGFVAYPFFQIGDKGGAEFSVGEEHPPYSSNSYPWQDAKSNTASP